MPGYVKKALLESEIKKNLDLSQKLQEEEERTEEFRQKLKESEKRYSNLISSDEYKLLDDYKSLTIQLNKLRGLAEEEEKKVNEYRASELEKVTSEIIFQTQQLRLLLAKEMKKIEDELSKKSRLVLELDIHIKNKNRELEDIESRIEVQDELNTVRPVTQ